MTGYRGGFKVRVEGSGGEIFACSPLYTGEPWGPMDEAVEEADALVRLLAKAGIQAEVSIGVYRQAVH